MAIRCDRGELFVSNRTASRLTSSNLKALSAHCRILTAVSSSHADTIGSKIADSENLFGSLRSACPTTYAYTPNATPIFRNFCALRYVARLSCNSSSMVDDELSADMASSRSRIHKERCC